MERVSKNDLAILLMRAGLLVDGYNVIKNLDRLQAKEKVGLKSARQELIRMLAAYKAAHPSLDIVIVFDAPAADEPDTARVGILGLKIIFDRSSADFRIKKIVESTHSPGGITVVSADKGITSYVRSLGANILSPSEMEQRLKAPERRHSIRTDKPLPDSAEAMKIDQELRKVWQIK